MGVTNETIRLRSKDDTRRGINSAKKNLAGLTRQAKAATLSIAGIAATAAMLKLTGHTLDAADAVDKLSKRTGNTVRFLSEMRFALSQNDATMSDFGNTLRKINKSSQDAADGLSTPIRAFQKLGLNVEAFQALNSDEKFIALSEAISKIKDPAIRTQAAMDIMGRAGERLMPTMIGGAKALAEYRAEAVRLGQSLSTEQAAGAAAAKDAIDRLTTSVSGAANQSILNYSGDIAALANWLTDAIPAAVNAAVSAFNMLAPALMPMLTAFASIKIGAVVWSALSLSVTGTSAAFSVAAVKALFASGSMTTMAVSAGVLKGAMALLGGPVGVIVLAAGAMALFITRMNRGKLSAENMSKRLEELRENAANLGKSVTEIEMAELDRNIAAVTASLANATKGYGRFGRGTANAEAQVEKFTDMLDLQIETKKLLVAQQSRTTDAAKEGTDALAEQTAAIAAAAAATSKQAAALAQQAEAQRLANIETARYKDAIGLEFVRTQQAINSTLDEAEIKTRNYNAGLEQAITIITSRGLVEGTEAYNAALEVLGFTTEAVGVKTAETTATVATLWENSVGTVQSTLQGFFEQGLTSFDGWYDSLKDSLKRFLAAFLAQWAASGILTLFKSIGGQPGLDWSGFSYSNAFGDGSGTGGTATAAATVAGQVFGESAGNTFNAAVSGAGGINSTINGVNQIGAGIEQGGTNGAISVVSGAASVYDGVIKTMAAYQALTTAAALAVPGGTITTAAFVAESLAIQTAAAAQTSAAIAALPQTVTVAAAPAAPALAPAAPAGGGAGSVAGTVAAAAVIAFIGSKAYDAIFSSKGKKADALDARFFSGFGANSTDFGPGGFGNASNDTAGGFGRGFAGTGLSSQQIDKDGATIVSGARLAQFTEFARNMGLEVKEFGHGSAEILNTSAEAIGTLMKEYAESVNGNISLTEQLYAAMDSGAVNSSNLMYENMVSGGFELTAAAARESFVEIDKGFDELVAGGADSTTALIASFSNFYGIASDDSVAFFNRAGLDGQTWIDNFTDNTGEGIRRMADFSESGRTQFAESAADYSDGVARAGASNFLIMADQIDQAFLNIERRTAASMAKVSAGANQLAGSGAALSLPAANAPLLGSFNTGGSFVVPGSGNTDRGFRINLTPGETVEVKPKAETLQAGRGTARNRDELIDAIYMLVDAFGESEESNKRLKGVIRAG